MIAPSSGRNTTAASIASALHHVDVFDRDGPAVSIIHDQDRKADGGFGRRDSQNEHREYLPHQIVQMRRERDQVDVDREQHQLDRHQNDNDVLPVQKNAEQSQRKQNRRDGQVMGEANF